GDDRELLVSIERWRLFEMLLDTDYCVRFLVPIDPGYLLTGLHRNRLRIEGEVFDLNFVFASATAAGVLHLAGYSEHRETTDGTQQRCDFDFTNVGIHTFGSL